MRGTGSSTAEPILFNAHRAVTMARTIGTKRERTSTSRPLGVEHSKQGVGPGRIPRSNQRDRDRFRGDEGSKWAHDRRNRYGRPLRQILSGDRVAPRPSSGANASKANCCAVNANPSEKAGPDPPPPPDARDSGEDQAHRGEVLRMEVLVEAHIDGWGDCDDRQVPRAPSRSARAPTPAAARRRLP